MDRRKFLKWGSFLTVSVATTTLAGCGGSNDDDGNEGGGESGGQTPPANGSITYSFPQGVASGDPRPDSIVLWTRIEGDAQNAVPVRVELAYDEAFAQKVNLTDATISAEPDWDHTVRHKITNLLAGTTYYYRFTVGETVSTVGRTRTAPAEAASVDELRFAFISCQDWSVNHWAAFDELVKEDLDFIVHLGDYVYETVDAGFQSGVVESAHGPLTLPDGTLRSDGATYATTLADYRTLYRSYRSDPRLQALHARFPMIAIWDDHEFSDDCWQDRQTYEVGDDETPRTARRRSANQAWFEFMPADVSLDLNNPSFNNIQIYRAFRFGKLASLVMTDQRLYRADHVIPETAAGSEIGSRYFVPKATLAALEGQKITAAGGALTPVSMLSDTQRAWWKRQMQNSTATWKLWGNEVSLLRMQFDGTQAVASLLAQGIVASFPTVPLQAATIALIQDLTAAAKPSPSAPPVTDYDNLEAVLAAAPASLPGPAISAIKDSLNSQLPPSMLLDEYLLNVDQWDGYNAERKDLMAHLLNNGIQNVVALTGDIHAFFAGSVMADYDVATADLEPVMVDLVTAGVSSNSFFSYFKSVVDTNPAFAAAKPLIYSESGGVVTNTFNTTLNQFNGNWMKYVDTNAQGYAVVSLTESSLSCIFKKLKPLDGDKAPASPAVASQQVLTVAAGDPNVTVVSPI
ncbi:Alkaline phosphatase D precursor [Bordetella ansorpii]|uniref:Alkaline phosphatase D n=1 Tax=Bordetella ansorpii TaxID=288768 RepID=A0A157SC81_9BORD|nr:alkaline phosphatase D family protein [Bordetella ansorpii]SAI67979.1 Alkaline phosphatase D precursor [Bordetella ansorpii]